VTESDLRLTQIFLSQLAQHVARVSNLAQCRRTSATPTPKSKRNLRLEPPAGASLSRNRMLASWQGIATAIAAVLPGYGSRRLQWR
jgi:hypothetical protein